MDFMLRVDGRYVCWHSHEARWYLGPKRLGEWFAADFRGGSLRGHYDGSRARKAHVFFPTAVRVWGRS